MKVAMDRREHPGSDDPVELAMLRYHAATEMYDGLVELNTWVRLNGDWPSMRARVEEERAFDELDSARHALFAAAAVAFPTIH